MLSGGTSKCTLPVWIPMRNFNVSLGRCRIVWFLTASSRFNDMDAISPACFLPFFIGKPETYIKLKNLPPISSKLQKYQNGEPIIISRSRSILRKFHVNLLKNFVHMLSKFGKLSSLQCFNFEKLSCPCHANSYQNFHDRVVPILRKF